MDVWAQSWVRKLPWPKLAKWRESFVSKAITFFSLASFGLAYFGTFVQRHGGDVWRLEAWLAGSVCFLLGYIMAGVWMPVEFSGSSHDLEEIADRMRKIDSYDFYLSRKTMTKNLVARMNCYARMETLEGAIKYARGAIKDGDTRENWTPNAAPLYHADIALRQYDRPAARLVSVVFMAIGLVLLLAPTLTNFVHAIGVVLHR